MCIVILPVLAKQQILDNAVLDPGLLARFVEEISGPADGRFVIFPFFIPE